MNWAGFFVILGLVGLAIHTLPWGLLIFVLIYLVLRTC